MAVPSQWWVCLLLCATYATCFRLPTTTAFSPHRWRSVALFAAAPPSSSAPPRSPRKASQPPQKRVDDEWDDLDVAPAADDIDGEEEETLGPQPGDFKSGFVSILGNPNVGKSTLINALLGEALCIVSPKPQTTRHRILGVLTEKNYQLVFSDTPGMMEPAYKLQEAMMESVRGAVGDADVILLVTDVYGEALADKTIMEKLEVTSRPVLVLVNKVDLVKGNTSTIIEHAATEAAAASAVAAEAAVAAAAVAAAAAVPADRPSGGASPPPPGLRRKLLLRRALQPAATTTTTTASAPAGRGGTDQTTDSERDDTGKADKDKDSKTDKKPKIKTVDELRALWAARLPRAEVVPVSALNRLGVDLVLSRILAHMQQGPKYFTKDTLTNRDERFFAAEIVRESVFHTYKDEVPYSCEVVIDAFKDRSPTLSVIEACIVVSKDSQKAILIGRGGAKLKELGTLARGKLEGFLGRKVFLSLHVRVDEDWRSRDDALAKYGYVESDFG